MKRPTAADDPHDPIDPHSPSPFWTPPMVGGGTVKNRGSFGVSNPYKSETSFY